jgi:hypothetical protein
MSAFLSKTPVQELKWYLSEQKNEYMIHATGHNSFRSQYLLYTYSHLSQILQIMHNKCVEKLT